DDRLTAWVILRQLCDRLASWAKDIQIGPATCALVVLDTGPPSPLPDDLLAAIDVIRPNCSEALALTGIEVVDRESAGSAAAALLRRGAGAAAVQAGESGDLLSWKDGEVWLPRFEVARLDATGAGDAFAGALAV